MRHFTAKKAVGRVCLSGGVMFGLHVPGLQICIHLCLVYRCSCHSDPLTNISLTNNNIKRLLFFAPFNYSSDPGPSYKVRMGVKRT